MNRMQTFLIALLLFALAGMSACSNESPRAQAAPAIVRNVPVLTVERSHVADVVEATGTVRAAQASTLSSQMMGNVMEIRVREGDHVHRGQVLALIDDSQPRAAVERALAADNAAQQQLAAADSDLALADSTLKRYQGLYEKKSVSPQEFDEVKARQQAALARREMAQAERAQAKAALAQAHTALGYTKILAPFDGLIVDKKVDPGSFASPGLPIFTLEDVRRYRLEASVSESDLRYIRNGQAVSVVIDQLGEGGIKGRVGEIVPAADPLTRSFTMKIDLPVDPRLRSGVFGRVQFPRGERKAVLIPREAVVERGQLQGVFLIDQNRVASLRYITLGKASGKSIEVLAGLEEGERVVARPGGLDLEGHSVEAGQ